MNKKYLFTYIYIIIFIAVSINIFYTFELINDFFGSSLNESYKHVLIAAIALEISWIFLYIWFLMAPIQRKDILLITSFSMIVANVLNNYTLPSIDFIRNLIYLSLFVSLYFVGYYLINVYQKRLHQNYAS